MLLYTGSGKTRLAEASQDARSHMEDVSNRKDWHGCVCMCGCGQRAVRNTKGLGRPPTRALFTVNGPFLSATRQAKPTPTAKDFTSNLENKREDGMDYVIFKTSPHNACNFLF